MAEFLYYILAGLAVGAVIVANNSSKKGIGILFLVCVAMWPVVVILSAAAVVIDHGDTILSKLKQWFWF